jgi:hypothetical protein
MGAALAVSGLVVWAVGRGGTEWTETPRGTLRIVTQEGGPTLGYSTTSGVTLLTEGGRTLEEVDGVRVLRQEGDRIVLEVASRHNQLSSPIP